MKRAHLHLETKSTTASLQEVISNRKSTEQELIKISTEKEQLSKSPKKGNIILIVTRFSQRARLFRKKTTLSCLIIAGEILTDSVIIGSNHKGYTTCFSIPLNRCWTDRGLTHISQCLSSKNKTTSRRSFPFW